MENIIYCDHHATTPMCEPAKGAMWAAMCTPGNASSSHRSGQAAKELVESSRRRVADLMGGVDPASIVFTSGATEANNTALRGVAAAARREGNPRPHILASAIEHSSILAVLRDMVEAGEVEAELVPVGEGGIVRVEDIAARIRPETVLVSVHGANNEVGTVQPVMAIGDLCAARGILFHADLCQSFGKIPFDASRFDTASMSAHKVYGPTGVGALYVRPEVRRWMRPLMVGGSQEDGFRGGTLNVHGIAGFGAACQEVARTWEHPHDGRPPESHRLRYLRDRMLARLQERLGDWVRVNGAIDRPCWEAGYDSPVRLPHNLNVTLIGVCPDQLHAAVRGRVSLSAAAACKSIGGTRSNVLEAMGVPDDGAVVRVGLGACNDEAQVLSVADLLADTADRLRGNGCEVRR